MKNVVMWAAGVVLVIGWCEYRTRDIAQQVAAEQEAENLRVWGERLLPLYEQMKVDHDADPATMPELLDPLFRTFEGIGEQ